MPFKKKAVEEERPLINPKGPLKDSVLAYIDKHHDRMTAEGMASHLGNPGRAQAIQDYINYKYGENRKLKKQMKLAEELETRPEWKHFRQQFTPEELDHFRYRYVQLMGQFRDDILPTEEMQIFQVISLDILVQRTMKEQKDIQVDMNQAHEGMEKISQEFSNTGDRELLNDLRSFEIRYAKASDSLKNLSQRYESYLMRQSAMLKELKATRDQRVKIFENSKQSFLGYLRLLQEEDQQAAVGKEAELMRLASEAEARRLAQPHTYGDGVVDQPLLTPDTVKDY